MCKCIERVNAQLADKNTKLYIPFTVNPESGQWSDMDRVVVRSEKIDTKKREGISSVIAPFCPFCGKPYTRANPSLKPTLRRKLLGKPKTHSARAA